MNLKTRRYLYITFILAFLTITPAVWLYAAGYKLGSGFKFEKTGILIFDSEPHGATIYLNDKIQKSFIQSLTKPDTAIIKTPAKIKGLLPEEYSVRLELDGYWPWEKKLEIKGEQSTYAENITLFRNNLPLNISQGNFDKVSLSPDQTWLIANNSTSVILVNLLNDKQMEFPINPENTQNDITRFIGAPIAKMWL